jgi:hypothetical protein
MNILGPTRHRFQQTLAHTEHVGMSSIAPSRALHLNIDASQAKTHTAPIYEELSSCHTISLCLTYLDYSLPLPYTRHRQIPASIWKRFRRRVHRAQSTVTYAKPCARPSPASSSPLTPCVAPSFALSGLLLHLRIAKNQSPARGWIT